MGQPPRFCGQCGAGLSPGARFCGTCGAPVAPAAAQQPVPPPLQGPMPPYAPERPVVQRGVATPAAPYGAAVTAPPSSRAEGGGCSRLALSLGIWAVFWLVVIGVVYLIWGRDEPALVPGLGVAALLSLALMIPQLSSGWKGQVVDIRTESVYVADEDGGEHEDQTFAYIRLTNGRVRKERMAWQSWQVGDWLEKRRGETHIRKL